MGNQRGFTMVEIAISVVVLAAMLAVAYPGFITANNTIAVSTNRDNMERAGDRIMERILEFLRNGRVVSVSGPGVPPFVTIRRVDRTVDLDDIDTDGQVPWQADVQTLRFRQNRIVSESTTREDINGDGDRSDNFALGVLEIINADGTRAIIEGGVVMLGIPSYAGDLDGDGTPDPLFTRTDRLIDIRLRLLRRTDQGQRLTTDLRGTVRLRNTQE